MHLVIRVYLDLSSVLCVFRTYTHSAYPTHSIMYSLSRARALSRSPSHLYVCVCVCVCVLGVRACLCVCERVCRGPGSVRNTVICCHISPAAGPGGEPGGVAVSSPPFRELPLTPPSLPSSLPPSLMLPLAAASQAQDEVTVEMERALCGVLQAAE